MPPPAEPDPAPPLTVTAHPPERRQVGRPVVLPAGCCCCCCCCLHTLGGVIGGVMGSVAPIETAPRRMTDPDSPFPFRRDEFESEGPVVPAALLYWLLTAFLIAVATGIYAFSWTPSVQKVWEGVLFGGVVAVMFLPVMQLGASVLSVLVILVFYPEKEAALKRIARITLWAFVGSILGLVVMWLGLVVLMALSHR